MEIAVPEWVESAALVEHDVAAQIWEHVEHDHAKAPDLLAETPHLRGPPQRVDPVSMITQGEDAEIHALHNQGWSISGVDPLYPELPNAKIPPSSVTV